MYLVFENDKPPLNIQMFGEKMAKKNPLQYSSLENYMYRGTWWAIAHGIAKSQT